MNPIRQLPNRRRDAALVASVLALAACSGAKGTAERDDGTDPRFDDNGMERAQVPSNPTAPGGIHTDPETKGKILKDGTPIVLRGFNRPSLEWSTTGENISRDDFATMASWGANVVRIPLNQGFWFNDSAYRDWVESNVEVALDSGLHVILDLHWNDLGTDNSAYLGQHVMADVRSLDFWVDVAETFKDEQRVMFELYNEPHDVVPEVWLNGGNVSDTNPTGPSPAPQTSGVRFEAVGMQDMYDAVRSTGADNLVIATGLDWGYSLKNLPEVSGYNIAYAVHVYDFPNKLPNFWQDDWAYWIGERPLIITEFGSMQCGGSYDGEVVDFARDNGISWTAWAWYPGGCSFPSLIENWDYDPTEAGRVVKAGLAD